MNNEQTKTPGRADVPTCSICRARHNTKVAMILGRSIPEAVVNLGEGQQTTGSHVGNASMVDVWKCPECGHSFRCDAQTEGRPKKERALPTDGRYETVEDFMRASGISEDVQREVASSLPKSAEPVVEERPENVLEKGLRLLTSERDQLRKELEESERQKDIITDNQNGFYQQLRTANEKLAVLTTENAALKEELSAALVDKELLKDLQASIGDYSNRTAMEISRSVQTEKELRVVQNELESLRSQFRWTPISERLPTEKDATMEPDYRGRPEEVVRWRLENGTTTIRPYYEKIPNATHWHSLPHRPKVNPPETEDQTSRNQFEDWAKDCGYEAFDVTPWGAYEDEETDCVWSAWKAGRQSTGGPA